ncbi:exonuclease SbcCD subunit D [Limosilactobacillus sp.]|jgi:exonuclease SbcD|uniref:exonuclease SbcCD subunit D n=1 Tax=Limosilactobacillus sp. TaxID=2773925 RepID=UPI0025C38E11|nr:exonuclease SbcCD subunit D [Limosilactobacillus sp.]MCH3922916.1 exonuclease SbcCD subunit D [Limosilactobacillus sp.]MCH3927599.1 exonuclease SbcCD subunit D [Limosilactobacillus sp.]
MRFLHTADWHIGKNLNGYDLLDDQVATFHRIERIAQEKQVDAVVIAGDLYDRSIPSEAAVRTLNSMLGRLNLQDHFPVLAISGNHDSATRLGTGADWFALKSLYLNTTLVNAFEPVIIKNTQFFLLPFFGIQEVRNYFHDDAIRNVNQAMERIVKAMKEKFAPDKAHVLVAHFFAAGAQRTADSETLVEVGGLSAVSTRLLAPFDYVALGHLHNRDALHDERARYSGSPMKFSVSEAKQKKGVWIVDTDPFKVEWVPLPPVHDIHLLKGSFADLVAAAGKHDPADFYDIELTDHERIPDVLSKLREHYPKIVSLHRTHQARQVETLVDQKRRRADPMDLLADFYQQTMGDDLSAQQRQWAQQSLEKISEED